jgi:hypothetical protein
MVTLKIHKHLPYSVCSCCHFDTRMDFFQQSDEQVLFITILLIFGCEINPDFISLSEYNV